MTRRILPGGYAWYLYGIAKLSEAESLLPAATPGVDGAALVATIAGGELAALVSAVSLTEFAADRVRSLAKDDLWLERVAREHQRVVDTLQGSLTIVPARLFSVYANDDDIRTALAESQSPILRTLQRLVGCDEFEIRLTFDRAALGRRLTASVSDIARLMEARAGATPGRAYLLDRQIATLLKRNVEATIDRAANEAFQSLRSHTIADTDLAVLRPAGAEATQSVVRRVFLVRRTQRGAFLAEAERAGLHDPDFRVGYSGPWPPYNFSDPDVPEEQESMRG